jgi:uncharacterized membrane protein
VTINQQLIKSNKELRAAARAQLKGKWGTAILLYIICGILASAGNFATLSLGNSRFIASFGIGVLIGAPLSLGMLSCFIKLVRNEPFRLENLFDGFSRYGTAVISMILMEIFVMLWSILLIIPGIIAGLRYSMTFFIIYDNPGISAMDALKASKEMMVGYKGKLFLLYLSFIGWVLLCILTLGIGLLWLAPYTIASFANFYQNIKDANETSFVKEPIL